MDVKFPICFIMPGRSGGPVGGYKIVYEYANRFCASGHPVSILMPYRRIKMAGFCKPDFGCRWLHGGLKDFVLWLCKRWLGARCGGQVLLRLLPEKSKIYAYLKARRIDAQEHWFALDERVRILYPFDLPRRFAARFPGDTRFVATWWGTACVLECQDVPQNRKFYFVQGYEAWGGVTEGMVAESYSFKMTKITIAGWLRDKIRAAGAEPVYIPNAIDHGYFRLDIPMASRNPIRVAMLWHEAETKRTQDAVEALHIVRRAHPGLHAVAFGACPPPHDLPDWIEYHRRPDRETHNRIYNMAAIFVAPSETEGWALCPAEAMACGCAVACTDIGGYGDYAIDGETALVSPVRDPEALAANILRLIEDDGLRLRIAAAGHENIKRFTWERSFAAFEHALLGS